MTANNILTKDDITLHHMSSNGLFWYQNRLFRMSKLKYYFDKIAKADCKFIQEGKKSEFLIDTNGIDEPSLVIETFEHKVYKHQVRIYEAPQTRIKDFIFALCHMHMEMLHHDLIANDIHEGNIVETIDGIKWLDWGSFVQLNKETAVSAFVLTAYLIHRHLLKTTHVDHNNICLDDIKGLGGPIADIANSDFTNPNSWAKLIQIVQETPVVLKRSFWAENYSNTMDIDHPESVGGKGTNVWNILQELDYETVTDVACNKGFYSFLAAKKAKSVLGFDYIPECITQAVNYNKQFKLPALFATTTIEAVGSTKTFERERFKSDLVLALAIVHHIDHIPATEFADMLSSICNKYILMEDIGTADIYQPIMADKGFILEKRIDSSPAPRTLSLYRKL